jgi:small subunit ribosomal protein S20
VINYTACIVIPKRRKFIVPNIKSAIKRVEVAERNRQRNKSWKSAVRTARNEVAASVKTGDPKKASEALGKAYQVIDKAVSKGILHSNTAARKKSRMAGEVLKLSSK